MHKTDPSLSEVQAMNKTVWEQEKKASLYMGQGGLVWGFRIIGVMCSKGHTTRMEEFEATPFALLCPICHEPLR